MGTAKRERTNGVESKGAARPRVRGGRAPASLMVGLWRAKRSWRLLLLLATGMTAAVLLACLVPLLLEATTVAGLRGAIASSPFANLVYGRVDTNTPTSELVAQEQSQLIANLHSTSAGLPYQLGAPSVVSIPLSVTGPGTAAPGSSGEADGVTLTALDPSAMLASYSLDSGRFPAASGGELEAVISPLTASNLRLRLGDALTLQAAASSTSAAITLRIVGFAHRLAAAVNQPDLSPFVVKAPPNMARQDLEFGALVSLPAIQTATVSWADAQPFVPYAPAGSTGGAPPFVWSIGQEAALDCSQMTWEQANSLLSSAPPSLFGSTTVAVAGAAVGTVNVSANLTYVVQKFRTRLIWGQVGVYVVLADVLGLVLLFLWQMLGALVEWQAPLIALLRSRGASRGQIARALLVQVGGIGLLATLAGPLLAVLVARWLATLLLGAQAPDIAAALGGNPLGVALGVWGFAAGAGVIFTAALVWSTWRAARRTVIVLRTEEARATRRPLWQRLYLDVIAALLALTGYSVYAIATRAAGSVATYAGNDVETALSPLALVAPMFLMVAVALLFARVLPRIFALAEWVAQQGNGAPALLAFSELARTGAQARRTVLLLAFTVCFGIFALTGHATLAQYITDSAAYATGADFSGGIAQPDASAEAGDASGAGQALASETATFASISGVTSVSVAYADGLSVLGPGETPQDWSAPQFYTISAVDPATYAQTILWPVQNTVSATSAIALLRAHEQDAVAQDAVPVVLNQAAATTLQAHVGTVFTLIPTGYGSARMRFITVGVVGYLPGGYQDQPMLGGGLLADYYSFATVYAHDLDTAGQHAAPPAPTYVWLRTRGDPASLASVRAATQSGATGTGLTRAYGQSPDFSALTATAQTDRRAYLASVRADPFYATLTGSLDAAALLALMLALVGVLAATWLRVERRRQGLAVLHALGLPAARVRRVVIWEHGVTLALALLLGALLGTFLSAVALKALPQLVLSSSIGGPIEGGGPSATILWPWPLLMGTGALVLALCAAITLVAARTAARPGQDSDLRLASE